MDIVPLSQPTKIGLPLAARPAAGPTAPRHSTLRPVLYRIWRFVPPPLRRLAIRLAMPTVTLAACAVIVDGSGRVLLARHTYRPQPWDLPGGFVGRSEQPPAALSREIREELGVQALIGPLLHANTYVPGQHLTLYYRVTLAGVPRCDGVEIDGYSYVGMEEVPRLLGTRPAWLECTCLQARQAA